MPIALNLITLVSSLAPSCTLTTTVAMMTLASSVRNVIVTSFFCLGPRAPIQNWSSVSQNAQTWAKRAAQRPTLASLTLCHIDRKETLFFSLNRETHLRCRWIGYGKRSGHFLLHATVAELDTVLWQASNHSFARR